LIINFNLFLDKTLKWTS